MGSHRWSINPTNKTSEESPLYQEGESVKELNHPCARASAALMSMFPEYFCILPMPTKVFILCILTLIGCIIGKTLREFGGFNDENNRFRDDLINGSNVINNECELEYNFYPDFYCDELQVNQHQILHILVLD